MGQPLSLPLHSTEWKFPEHKIGDKEAKQIAAELKVNKVVRTLILRNNEIDDEGGKAISDALRANTSLHNVDLGGNKIGDVGVRAIAQALKFNTSLKTLVLCRNIISDDGGKAIAEALKINTALQILNLQTNRLHTAGGKAIAEALEINTSLRTLDLGWNWIIVAGAKAFAKALQVNTSLHTLGLQSNEIGHEGGKAIAEALKVNTSLQTLHLQSTEISHEADTEIKEFLDRNRKSATNVPKQHPSPLSTPTASPTSTTSSSGHGQFESPTDQQYGMKSSLLDRPIQDLAVSYTCVRGKRCPGHIKNLDDNDRRPSALHALYTGCNHSIAISDPVMQEVAAMTANKLFECNEQGLACPLCHVPQQTVQLQVVCCSCKADHQQHQNGEHLHQIFSHSFLLQCADTIQKLYLDLREVVCNDLHSFQPVYPNFAEISTSGIPHAPLALCHTLSKFNETSPSGEAISKEDIEAISLSLQTSSGALWQKLDQKKKAVGTEAYLRIGLVHHRIFGKHNVVLELWPLGHRSPIHQHGGCAGAMYVAFGKLHATLFHNLATQDVLASSVIQQGSYAFLDRANFDVHQVETVKESDEDPNFALLLHLYMSCTDEFGFINEGEVVKKNPQDDFVWLYFVDDESDLRVAEVRSNPDKDFIKQVLQK